MQANNQTLSGRRACATFLFKICSCATVPKETALKLKDFHAEETKAFGNGALTGEGDNLVKGDNKDDDDSIKVNGLRKKKTKAKRILKTLTKEMKKNLQMMATTKM